MKLSNVKNIDIVEIFTMLDSTNYQLVKMPSDFSNFKDIESDNKMYFEIFDILHFSILKTNDNNVRHCACYINELMLTEWIDLSILEDEFYIINYHSYSKLMKSLNQEPLSLHNYVIQKFKGTDIAIPPNELVLDCSINQYNVQYKTKINFNLLKIHDGYYDNN